MHTLSKGCKYVYIKLHGIKSTRQAKKQKQKHGAVILGIHQAGEGLPTAQSRTQDKFTRTSKVRDVSHGCSSLLLLYLTLGLSSLDIEFPVFLPPILTLICSGSKQI